MSQEKIYADTHNFLFLKDYLNACKQKCQHYENYVLSIFILGQRNNPG